MRKEKSTVHTDTHKNKYGLPEIRTSCITRTLHFNVIVKPRHQVLFLRDVKSEMCRNFLVEKLFNVRLGNTGCKTLTFLSSEGGTKETMAIEIPVSISKGKNKQTNKQLVLLNSVYLTRV